MPSLPGLACDSCAYNDLLMLGVLLVSGWRSFLSLIYILAKQICFEYLTLGSVCTGLSVFWVLVVSVALL